MKRTLKGRLYVMLIASTIIPILMIGGISVYSIQSILENKIDKGIRNNLALVQHNLETTLENMDYTSQQFTVNGLIGQTMSEILETADPYEMLALRKTMEKNITLLNFTNPIVGVTLYYDTNTMKVLYANQATNDLSFDELPALSRLKGTMYYGPHKTFYKYSNNLVFSQSREFDITGNYKSNGIGIYVETNFKHFQNILDPVQYGMEAFHLLIDSEERVLYSENKEMFVPGNVYKPDTSDQYKEFRLNSAEGFGTVLYIKSSDYDREVRKWSYVFLSAALISLLVSFLIAIAIRKIVYKPLLNIKKGISLVADSQLEVEMNKSGLVEFDYIIDHFNGMRLKIMDLILRVEQEEKDKRAIEVEKLMAQINPHFLYNTLNTIQWLARMKGQTEIDRFVSLFTNVLNYNLAKGGMMVTVKDEVRALEDYVELQKVRYDYLFDVRIDVDEEALEDRVPRFLLQPLVENALYHGLKDKDIDGLIEVFVNRKENGQLSIMIRDNGAGMDEQEVRQLMEGSNHRSGLGIGLNYVDKTVKSYFGPDCGLAITSKPGAGTEIKLLLPIKEEVQHDQSDNRG